LSLGNSGDEKLAEAKSPTSRKLMGTYRGGIVAAAIAKGNMPYDSPKQIRRRQQEAEKPRTALRPRRRIPAISEADWNRKCDYHVNGILTKGAAGYHEMAAAHAEALVFMAIQYRLWQW
jgi:dihydroorotase-like cyclic amidohydrolase